MSRIEEKLEPLSDNDIKFNRLQDLSRQLHLFFSANAEVMPYMTSSKYITAWLQNMADINALSIRDKLFGSLQMNALSNILHISRTFVYDRAHTLCFTEKRNDVCSQLLKMITEINFDALEEAKILTTEIFRPCQILYENPYSITEEKISVCMSSWIKLYDVLSSKVKELTALLQALMGTSWILKRAEISERATGFFNKNLQESLYVSETSQEETFLLTRDIANVMFNTTTSIQRDIADLTQKIQSIEFTFKTTTNPLLNALDHVATKVDRFTLQFNDMSNNTRRLIQQVMDSNIADLKQELQLLRITQLPETLQDIITIKASLASQAEQQTQIEQKLQALSDAERKLAETIITMTPAEIKEDISNMMNQRIQILLADMAVYKEDLESNIAESKSTRQQLISIQQRMAALPQEVRQQTQHFFELSSREMLHNLQVNQTQHAENQRNIAQFTVQILNIKESLQRFNRRVNEQFTTLNQSIPDQITAMQHQFDQKIAEIQATQMQIREEIDEKSSSTEVKQIIQDLDTDVNREILQQVSSARTDMDNMVAQQFTMFESLERKLAALQEQLTLEKQDRRAEMVKNQRIKVFFLLAILFLAFFTLKFYIKLYIPCRDCPNRFYTA